jgi:hypothetical protein
VSTMANFRLLGVAACLSGVLLTTVLPSDAMAGGESSALGSHSSRVSPIESFAPFIAEAFPSICNSAALDPRGHAARERA